MEREELLAATTTTSQKEEEEEYGGDGGDGVSLQQPPPIVPTTDSILEEKALFVEAAVKEKAFPPSTSVKISTYCLSDLLTMWNHMPPQFCLS